MSDPTSQLQRPLRRTRSVAPANLGPTSGDGTASGSHLGNLHLVNPLEIFAGLAAACVPAFCDGLRFDLAGDGGNSVNVSYPDAAADGANGHLADDDASAGRDARGGRITVAVRSEPAEGEAAIEGTITCTWRDPQRPSEADAVMARLLADQALAKVRMERLAAALREQRTRAANLEMALATNREIGQAIGILMAIEHLTAGHAFERLRTASQHSHRKLRDIAADVTETGVLAATQPAPAPVAPTLHLSAP